MTYSIREKQIQQLQPLVVQGGEVVDRQPYNRSLSLSTLDTYSYHVCLKAALLSYEMFSFYILYHKVRAYAGYMNMRERGEISQNTNPFCGTRFSAKMI